MNRERALTWKKMRAQQTRRKKARLRTALEVIRRLEWDPACCAAAGACYMSADGGQVCQYKAIGSATFDSCFNLDGTQLVGSGGSCGGQTCYFTNPARADSQCTC